MNKSFLATLLGATLLTSTLTFAQDMKHDHKGMPHCHHCVTNITPNGVMGDHTHKKGEWMASYSYMHMDMGGMRNGTSSLSDAEILAFPSPTNLRVAPTKMTMDMHMLGLMGGVTDNITGMVMVPYIEKDMESRVYNMAGTALVGNSSMQTSGLGDIELSATTNLWKDNGHRLNGRLGLSLPTGAIDETDTMLMPSGMTMTMRTPYGMQLGTGTYDILPSLIYAYDDYDWSFGAEYKARLHTGRNSEGYTKGDWHQLTGWAGYRLSDTFGMGTSVTAKTENEIDRRDANINGMMPGANPDYYGGETIDLGLNVGWKFYKMKTLKAEIKAPIYQNLNGVQMEKDYSFGLKFQGSF